MQRSLHIDPDEPTPIWRQIEEGIRHLVASGVLEPSSPVPSVREMSREMRVNPATVSKAYQRLVGDGVLQVKRGEGTFVADSPPAISREQRRGAVEQAAMRYASLGVTLGASLPEVRGELERAWAALAGGDLLETEQGDP